MDQNPLKVFTEKMLSNVDQKENVSNKERHAEDKRDTKRPFVVSIEGNIGSGKSTMINYFKNFQDIQIHPEPVEKW